MTLEIELTHLRFLFEDSVPVTAAATQPIKVSDQIGLNVTQNVCLKDAFTNNAILWGGSFKEPAAVA